MSKSRQSIEIAVAAIVFTVSASTVFAAPTAVEILKKTQSIMEKAKTYQAVMLVNTDAGKMGKMTLRLDIKKSGKKSALSTSPVGQASGQFAMLGAGASSQIVDDGVNMWIYTPMLKSYMKRPSMGGKGVASPFQDIAGMTKQADIKLTGTESVSGRPSYVIQVNPKKAPKGGSQKVTFYIDQATYHMTQMKMNSTTPSMSGSSQQVLVTMQVQSEKFDQPVADSAFRFTPPAGVKEMQGGFPGMMGGGAGRPRG
jgi:outer membrane lipoprotein-sorting protein